MKLETRFSAAEQSPGFMLWKAANLLQRLHTRCLRDLDVTPAQFSFLTCLVYLHERGPVTPTDIVNHAGLDKMMVSDLVKTLERKRFLRKKENPNDGRSFLVEPTASGIKTTNAAVKEVEKVDDDFFSQLKSARAFHADLVTLVRGATERE
jgi:DNA-binding MarR family transcriptional regulator